MFSVGFIQDVAIEETDRLNTSNGTAGKNSLFYYCQF